MVSNENTRQIYTVAALNHNVRQFLEEAIPSIWVRGEISNLCVHRSGHVYFSLKDDRASISCAFFRAAGQFRRLALENGSELNVHGRVSLYETAGRYQLILDQIEPLGKGTLQEKFEALKKRLAAEGLFDDDRKQSLPTFPTTISIVTSPQGAALRDFLQILNRRFANRHVRIFPAAVQGESAASDIARGIHFFNTSNACDVIIITRGGGSLEDLWPFNEEVVARAIAASHVPVISAIGHEVDLSISDLVADVRAPTPSAAAELVVGAELEFRDRIRTLNRHLTQGIQMKLMHERQRLHRFKESPLFREPAAAVRIRQQRLDDLTQRLERNMTTQLRGYRQHFTDLAAKLQAMNPQKTLERGYAVLLDRQTRDIIMSHAAVTPEQTLTVKLYDGEINVISTDNQENSAP